MVNSCENMLLHVVSYCMRLYLMLMLSWEGVSGVFGIGIYIAWAFPCGSGVKHPPVTQKTRVRSLGWEDPLEKEMATHSSVLAWEIPWTEEPGRLQSTGFQRVGQDLVTKHTSTYIVAMKTYVSMKTLSYHKPLRSSQTKSVIQFYFI